jgi:hypothetical protein
MLTVFHLLFRRDDDEDTPDRSHVLLCPYSDRFSSIMCALLRCRDDDEDTPDRSHKPVPEWAKPAAVLQTLKAQRHIDPDSIFKTSSRQDTCDLTDMFKGMWLYKLVGGSSICMAAVVVVHPLSGLTVVCWFIAETQPFVCQPATLLP